MPVLCALNRYWETELNYYIFHDLPHYMVENYVRFQLKHAPCLLCIFTLGYARTSISLLTAGWHDFPFFFSFLFYFFLPFFYHFLLLLLFFSCNYIYLYTLLLLLLYYKSRRVGMCKNIKQEEKKFIGKR